MLDPGAFLERVSGWRKGNPADLLLALHRCHQEQAGPSAQPLSEFLEWAPTTLRDFSEIDNHLLELGDFYRDLRNYHEIEEWSLRTTEPLSKSQQQAVQRWAETGELHLRFAKAMAERGLGTAGTIGREALRKANTPGWESPWDMVWAAGLNALEPSLKSVLRSLRERGILRVCWDADTFYLNNSDHEAGRFLRESITSLGQGEISVSDTILSGARNVQLVTLPDRMAMCRFAAHWAAKVPTHERDQAAVVLADEQLLLPLLQAMPSDIGPMNVSMGVPVQELPLHGLADRFLRYHAQADGRVRTAELIALLNHPLLHQGESTSQLVTSLTEVGWPSQEVTQVYATLQGAGLPEEALAALSPTSEDPDALLQALFRWVVAVRPDDALAREQAYHMAVLQRELRLAMQRNQAVLTSLRDTVATRERLIGQARISFFGEPLRGLQVLGVLETRALSFKHVLLVGASEGILIGQDDAQSWIPFDLRRHFKLPLRADSEAVSSYHVHRLLQGSEHFIMAHAPAPDGSGSPARFMEQWEHEFGVASRSSLSRQVTAAGTRSHARPELVIRKDANVIERIQALISRGISPTAMATWLRCPMDFHAKYILGINEQKEVASGFGDDALGIAVHRAAERIYSAWLGAPLSRERLLEAAQDADAHVRTALAQDFPMDMLESGSSMLRGSMAAAALRRVLGAEADREALGRTIPVAVEHEMSAELLPGIRIRGKADRLEQRDGVLCVLDIKTGSFQNSNIQMKELIRGQLSSAKQQALQLMIYASLALHGDESIDSVQAGIIPLRHSSLPDAAWLNLEGSTLISRAQLRRIDDLLLELINEMLDPEKPIMHDPSSSYCQCCIA